MIGDAAFEGLPVSGDAIGYLADCGAASRAIGGPIVRSRRPKQRGSGKAADSRGFPVPSIEKRDNNRGLIGLQ